MVRIEGGLIDGGPQRWGDRHGSMAETTSHDWRRQSVVAWDRWRSQAGGRAPKRGDATDVNAVQSPDHREIDATSVMSDI
jgi:hypothetical protein